MIGLKFVTGQGDVVEAISEPFVVRTDDTEDVMVFVKDLRTDSTYEELLYSLKRMATEKEVRDGR